MFSDAMGAFAIYTRANRWTKSIIVKISKCADKTILVVVATGLRSMLLPPIEFRKKTLTSK